MSLNTKHSLRQTVLQFTSSSADNDSTPQPTTTTIITMSLGLLSLASGPLQMLFSLLLMQGLSMTMFRSFLQQAVPRFDPMKFQMSYGTDSSLQTTTTTQRPPQDGQQLLQYLQLMSQAMLLQQQRPAIQPISVAQPLQATPTQLVMPSITQQHVQPSSMPAHVIIVPQVMSSQDQKSSSAASTHFPIRVPLEEPTVSRAHAQLERPPKTTRRPNRVVSRGHAGTLVNVQFATPRATTPARRVIPAVTADYKSVLLKSEPEVDSVTTVANIGEDNPMKNLIDSSEDMEEEEEKTTSTTIPLTTTSVLNSTQEEEEAVVHEDFVRHVTNLTKDEEVKSVFVDSSSDLSEFKRVCFFLIGQQSSSSLSAEDIDPFICSHLVIGFASLSSNGLLVARNPNEDPNKYREVVSLKSKNRRLKVMLSVGDNGSPLLFSKMAAEEKTRDAFVTSCLDFADNYDFDGIDIDWEFPSWKKTNKEEDKLNLVQLLKELRAEAVRRFRPDFSISVSVGTPLLIAMSSYDIPLLAEAVDFVNLLAYDVTTYRKDRPFTQHHSPLYPRPTQRQYLRTLNAAWAATYWANNGMPLEKVVLGVPLFARSFQLVTPLALQGLDSPASGPGIGGGRLNYTAVCRFLQSGATKEFDVYSQVPFAHKDSDWVSYESEISAQLKAQWVVKAGMGGVMTYALNYDDVTGECRSDKKRFPLQKAISNFLELSSMKSYRRRSHSPEVNVKHKDI